MIWIAGGVWEGTNIEKESGPEGRENEVCWSGCAVGTCDSFVTDLLVFDEVEDVSAVCVFDEVEDVSAVFVFDGEGEVLWVWITMFGSVGTCGQTKFEGRFGICSNEGFLDVWPSDLCGGWCERSLSFKFCDKGQLVTSKKSCICEWILGMTSTYLSSTWRSWIFLYLLYFC